MISANQYFDIYIYSLFTLTVISLIFAAYNPGFFSIHKKSYNKIIFFLFVLPLILFFGLRPISDVFGDMSNYERYFSIIALSSDVSLFYNSDIIFLKYIQLCTKIMDVKTWFFLTSFITIALQYWAIKRLFPRAVYIFFLATICSLTFYGSVVNGLRIGMAMSVFLVGLSFYKKRYLMFLIFLISIGLHKSMILPALSSIMAFYFSNTKYYIYIWFIAVIISLSSSSILGNIFNRFSFIDPRLDLYESSNINPSKFSYVGFRYDFLLYSFIPILFGYFVYRKNNLKKDHQIYVFLLNTYIIANAFWVLIIEANYSNRFASLSWFLWPFITIYPILYIINKQYKVLIAFFVILVELAVTFFIS